jgi:hypothetical protein
MLMSGKFFVCILDEVGSGQVRLVFPLPIKLLTR